MSSTPQPSLPHAQYERFESMREYEAMFDELIPKTERVIRIFDKSLAASYNTTARCELLRQFLRADPLNRLYIVVHEVEGPRPGVPALRDAAAALQPHGQSAADAALGAAHL